MRCRHLRPGLALLLILIGLHVASAASLPLPAAARPEDAGMSSDRLQAIGTLVRGWRDEGRLAGAVTAVARSGRLVHLEAHGFADLETKTPMRPDAIFAIASMTKPIATAALLILLDEQRLQLGDPVEKFLAEFGHAQVAEMRAGAPDGFVLVPALRSITLLDLLTHRAGFPGLPPLPGPAETLKQQALGALPPDFALADYVAALASVPLERQPGTLWKYSEATTVLGRVIEVASGQSLDQFLHDRIFSPLGMVDTGFRVPEDQVWRVASCYDRSASSHLKKVPPFPTNPRFFSAGGNLFSTVPDYLRFCQMLLNGGELDGRRVLRRETAALMTASHVDPFATPFIRGHYFGLGVAVQKSVEDSGLRTSPGTFGWGGAFNTYFRIVPREEIILVFFAQQLPPNDTEMVYAFHNAVAAAIAAD